MRRLPLANCNKCSNKDKDCYRCGEHNNFPCFKEKGSSKSSFSKKNSRKEGMGFQRKVKDAYNQAITAKPKAYETPNSGAIWHMPGDVVTEDDLMECKERGSLSAKGEKQITIKKDWLDKAKEEAFPSKRMLLPFGFKNDDEIYLVTEFDTFLGMVQTIDELERKIQELTKNGE